MKTMFLVILLHLIGGTPQPCQATRSSSYFAMCLIVKHDAYLHEWIEYHGRMGCSKFYIFDHNNTVPLEHSLYQYIDNGLVDVVRIGDVNKPNSQLYSYQRCVDDYGSKHQFMAFIDSDEYIVVVNKSLSIPDVLRGYEAYGGLILSWKVFGSSGHVTRPTGGLLTNYNRCVDDYRVKTIGNMEYTTGSINQPHSMSYKEGYYSVDTEKNANPGPYNPLDQKGAVPQVLHSIMYINHYHTKSLQDWEIKMKRGRRAAFNAGGYTPKYTLDMFNALRNITESRANCSYLQMPSNRLFTD
jgi:hypothetical protein